jgi:hypothetical protein
MNSTIETFQVKLSISDPNIKMILIGNKLMIETSGKDLSLTYEISRDNIVTTFELVDIVFYNNDDEIIFIKAEDVLVPFVGVSGIALKESIVHYKSDDKFHLRIVENQLNSIWKVDRETVHTLGNGEVGKNWTIDITDYKYYSSCSY